MPKVFPRKANIYIISVWVFFTLGMVRETQVEAQGPATIAGRVLFRGEIPQSGKLAVTKDSVVCGQVEHFDERLVVGRNRGIRYAVISVIGVSVDQSLPGKELEPVLDQVGCVFLPRMRIVPNRTSLRILNNDNILHNFHTYPKLNTPVNLAHPSFIEEIEASFLEPEEVLIKCDVHPWMRAWFIVVDHPYHAITDLDGKFKITGIPPGTYQIRCWQEKLGEQSVEIEFASRERVEIDFTFQSIVQP